MWLGGSRARGTPRPDSDWDVVAFSKHHPTSPADLFKSNQTSDFTLEGGPIELVMAHPDHWNDPRLDLGRSGLRLR